MSGVQQEMHSFGSESSVHPLWGLGRLSRGFFPPGCSALPKESVSKYLVSGNLPIGLRVQEVRKEVCLRTEGFEALSKYLVSGNLAVFGDLNSRSFLY